MRRMMFLGGLAWLLFCGALLVGLVAVPAPGHPQTRCMPLDVAEQALADIGEQLFVIGYSGGGDSKVHVYVNPANRGWTIIAVNPQGMGCPIAAGTGFDMVKQPPAGKAS